MLTILGGSFAFSIGAAFMKSSQGFTRLLPTVIVFLSFLLGAALLTRAVNTNNMSTTVIVGLGFEALITVTIGIFLLGDRLTIRQGAGMLLVLAGTALVHR
jgi:quaternary ammonium compound-resistance protein SugE